MRTQSQASSNVVRFRPQRAMPSPRRDQRSLMDAVYNAGSLPVPADDRMTKVVASRLQIFGFVTIDEVRADGTLRRLKPSEAINASSERPWRISKASFAWGGTSAPEAEADLFAEPEPA
jgi:hypothetical protein